MATSLFSNFTGSHSYSSISDQLAFHQLDSLYSQSFDDTSNHVWTDFEIEFTIPEIVAAINDLKESKGDGPMGISVKFFKYHCEALAPMITSMFDNIAKHSFLPENWKCSFLSPIPKKGKLSEIGNYRGIAISSVLPRLYDKLLTSKIYERMSLLIPPEQHGFMKGRSTTTNLFDTSQFIAEELANGGQVDAV